MYNKEKFIAKSDILFISELTVEETFEQCLFSFLEEKDYDSVVTMFALFMNKNIKNEFDQYREVNHLKELPERLDKKEGLKLHNELMQWQPAIKDLLLSKSTQMINLITDSYEDINSIPKGLIECLRCLGRALVLDSFYSNGVIERNWELISILFALAYEEHIKIQNIRGDLVAEYKSANFFVTHNDISLPYYYVAIWGLWKIGANGESLKEGKYETNRNQIKSIIERLPDFYKSLLSGELIYPEDDRVEVVAVKIDSEGNEKPAITIEEYIKFDEYFPTFVQRYRELEFVDHHSGEFFHPMNMTSLPCIKIAVDVNIPLYLNNIFNEIELENLRKKVENLNRSSETVKGDSSYPGRNKYIEKVENSTLNPQQKIVLIKKLECKEESLADQLVKHEFSNGRSAKNTVTVLKEQANISSKAYNDAKKIYGKNLGTTKKDTLFAIAFAMRLSVEETEEMLNSSGYTFSDSLVRDIVIRFLIENQIYNMVKVNIFLNELELDIISGKLKDTKIRKTQKISIENTYEVEE